MKMSWRDYLNTLPEAQRKCAEDPGHCGHLDHSTCCLCGHVTKECADPECDSTAYLGSEFCAKHA